MKVIHFPDGTLSLRMSPGFLLCCQAAAAGVFCVFTSVCVQLTFVKHQDGSTHRFQAHDHYKHKQKNVQKKTKGRLKCVVRLPAPSGLVCGWCAAGECPINDSHVCGRMIREYPKHQQSSHCVWFRGAAMWLTKPASVKVWRQKKNKTIFFSGFVISYELTNHKLDHFVKRLHSITD